MIDEGQRLEIAGTAVRPDAEVAAKFRGVPTSFIVDAMGGRGAMDWRIKAAGSNLPFVGVALTCYCGPADNLALCAAVARCAPGDVILAATDGFTGTAVVGDLLLGIARNRGAAAFVTDGLVRDLNDIAALELPCYAAGATPNSPARNGPGTVGMAVHCGGLQVATGDVVAGDRDGVVVIPYASLASVVSRLAGVRAAEAALLARVKAGLAEVDFIPRELTGAAGAAGNK